MPDGKRYGETSPGLPEKGSHRRRLGAVLSSSGPGRVSTQVLGSARQWVSTYPGRRGTRTPSGSNRLPARWQRRSRSPRPASVVVPRRLMWDELTLCALLGADGLVHLLDPVRSGWGHRTPLPHAEDRFAESVAAAESRRAVLTSRIVRRTKIAAELLSQPQRSMPTEAHLSQLCPNSWVPGRPAQSHCVLLPKPSDSGEQRNRDPTGRVRTERDSDDLSDNAEVAGSIPASPTPDKDFPGRSGSRRVCCGVRALWSDTSTSAPEQQREIRSASLGMPMGIGSLMRGVVLEAFARATFPRSSQGQAHTKDRHHVHINGVV
jgi:hypothetical protein